MKPLLFDLSDRALFFVTGEDRIRFMNGQVSNNVRSLQEGRSIAACVMTAKGKMNGLIWIANLGDRLRFDIDGELRESIAARLDRYIIADDVQLEDHSDELALLHLIGSEWNALGLEGLLPSTRFAAEGFDLFVPKAELDTTLQRLSSVAAPLTPSAHEMLRIEQGLPRWGFELDDNTIPVEAGLESSTIDYSKGCYIGQEVISRIKSIGQVARMLRGLVPLDGQPLPTGVHLLSESGAARRDAGRVTSACFSENLGCEIGLGYVKRAFAEPGGRVWLEQNSVLREVEVRQLPFLKL